MICPLSMASAVGALPFRRRVEANGIFQGVQPLEPHEAFTSRVDVICGLFLIMRGLRPERLLGASAWMAGPAEVQEAAERLSGSMPTLEAAGCRVKLGMATGCNDAFVGAAECLKVEPDLLVPVVDISDIATGELVWRGRYVINTHRPDGSPWRQCEYPHLYSRLRSMKQRLTQRSTVSNGKSWRLTHSQVDYGLARAAKLLVPETGRHSRVALDPGGHMPLNSVHAITSRDWPLQPLWALLASAGIGLQAVALSLQRSGGHLRLNATGLRRVRIPFWKTLTKKDAHALLSGDRSRAAEAAARIYGLTDALLRCCAAVGWERV
jgi:hypothetical protein